MMKPFSRRHSRAEENAQTIAYVLNTFCELSSVVAAFIIISLLMLSGDVESNPGPELDYDSVDAELILNEEDLSDVMEEVQLIKLNYFPLGRSLRLADNDLKAISESYPSESTGDKELNDVLLLWLNRKYNTNRFGLPTWRMLVEAVNKRTGGNNYDLAKAIALNHPAAVTSDNVKEMLDLAWGCRARWKYIGIELGIDVGTLDAISHDNKRAEDCLSELITLWLHQSNPRPTRKAMVKAVESVAVSGVSPINEAHSAHSSYFDETTIEVYKTYIKSLYKAKAQESFVFADQWPPPVTRKVFRLAMIETEQLRMKSTEDEFLRLKTIVGKVDSVIEHNIKRIELEDIFRGTVGRSRKVLIEGAPGSGKSTLSLQMCYLWNEGRLFNEYKLIILVRLRDPAVQCAKKSIDLFPCRDESMALAIEKSIMSNDGNGVLLVLDGWDELPPSAPGHSIILSLLDRTLLHRCSIIVTSRPTSSANLHPLITSRIEILGFTRKELEHFFSDCLQNNVTAVKTLLHKIRQNPAVEGCCYLPVNASVIVHLFKCEENLYFASQYNIFSALVCNCIIRHLRKYRLSDEVSAVISLDNLPEVVYYPFQVLCRMAYEGIVTDRVTFDNDKIGSSFSTLGLLQGVESFAGCGITRSFHFIHLSVQEVLAAYHIATQFDANKQVSTFKLMFGKARFNSVFGFFAAKTKLQSPGINDIIMTIVGKCSVEGHSQEDKVQLLSLLRCLFEAQDPSLCQLVVDQRVKHILSFGNFFRYITGSLPDHISELNLHLSILNPFDCLCIGYFLACIQTVLDVNLSSCSIGSEGCKTLFRAEGQVYRIRKLFLNGNLIGDEGAVAISSGLKTMFNLEVLNLWNNSIGNEGAVAISEATKTMTNLQKLYLWDNCIGDEGALAISDAMRNTKNLHTLYLSENFIGDRGAVAISETLKVMTGFQSLYIWRNPIGEVGKQALKTATKEKGTYLRINVYAEKQLFNMTISEQSLYRNWKSVDTDEMKGFIAVILNHWPESLGHQNDFGW